MVQVNWADSARHDMEDIVRYYLPHFSKGGNNLC